MARDPQMMVNPHDVWCETASPYLLYAGSGSGSLWSEWTLYIKHEDGKDRRKDFKTFDAGVAATRFRSWSRIRWSSGSAWIPSEFAVDGLRWIKHGKGDSPDAPGAPVKFDPAEHACEVCQSADMGRWTQYSTCGRVAVGIGKIGHGDADGPICSMHEKIAEKRVARRAQWEAEWEADRVERNRERESEQAAREMVERVVATLRKLDVAAADKLVGTDGAGRLTLTTDAAEALCKAVDFYEGL